MLLSGVVIPVSTSVKSMRPTLNGSVCAGRQKLHHGLGKAGGPKSRMQEAQFKGVYFLPEIIGRTVRSKILLAQLSPSRLKISLGPMTSADSHLHPNLGHRHELKGL